MTLILLFMVIIIISLLACKNKIIKYAGFLVIFIIVTAFVLFLNIIYGGGVM